MVNFQIVQIYGDYIVHPRAKRENTLNTPCMNIHVSRYDPNDITIIKQEMRKKDMSLKKLWLKIRPLTRTISHTYG